MSQKKWNWQQEDWPNFSYIKERIEPLEKEYLKASGLSFGMLHSLDKPEQSNYAVELMSDEAIKTSEIEGEILNRDSVRSSIIREFGLSDNAKLAGVKPEEQGIAKMMKQLYSECEAPLTYEMLNNWHSSLMYGSYLIKAGDYRTHKEDMKVVSGPIHRLKTHFIAPASKNVPKEMDVFINWFNKTAPGEKEALPPLTRAGIAHLHFLSVHPYEDGNGRISRALITKALSQEMKAPVLIAVSSTINTDKKQYYKALGVQNEGNEITAYLDYFGKTVIEAQNLTVNKLEFITAKTKYFEHFRGKLNQRQEIAITKIFNEGLKGFEGGLSVKNYIAITKAARATATRDLADLVKKEAFTRTGQLKSTRYELNLKPFQNKSFLGIG